MRKLPTSGQGGQQIVTISCPDIIQEHVGAMEIAVQLAEIGIAHFLDTAVAGEARVGANHMNAAKSITGSLEE